MCTNGIFSRIFIIVAGMPVASGYLPAGASTDIALPSKCGLYVLVSRNGAQVRELCICEHIGLVELSTSVNKWYSLTAIVDSSENPTHLTLTCETSAGASGRDYHLFLVHGV